MANKNSKKTVETLTHEEVRRKNIPTAEFQSVVGKEEQHSTRVVVPRSAAGLEKEKASRNRDLDPQLIWCGKDEQDWSDLVVHEGPGQWANEIIAGYFTPTRILFNGSKAVSLWR
jgi:adenine-specific DNA-methyltransferase